MKILITGGHVTPALAVIEELKKHPGIDIVFVGRKYVNSKEKTTSFEYQVIKNAGVRFIHIETGRLTRLFSLHTLIDFLQSPLGLLRSWNIIRKENPDCVLSFGGYIAFPLAIVALFLRIPLFTHEQTIAPGFTNRMIAHWAQKIFISFPETARYFNHKKTIITGNPLRTVIFSTIKKPFDLHKTKPVVYITGGSLGSHSINLIVESILPDLLKKYHIIHQAGDSSEYQDFKRLSHNHDQNYFLFKHFSNNEIGHVYSMADIVIARAGANTIGELIALQKPAVLIPLPWSSGGEQKAHAEFMQKKRVAEIFDQEKHTFPSLLLLIEKIIHNKNAYIKNYVRLKHYFYHNASKTIVRHILSKA